MTDLVKEHGFTAVARDTKTLISGNINHISRPIKIEDIPFPKTELIKKVQDYAKSKLGKETYNHSMRVYYYGNWIGTYGEIPKDSISIQAEQLQSNNSHTGMSPTRPTLCHAYYTT